MVGREVMQGGRPPSVPRWPAWLFILPGLGLIAGAGVAAWMELDFRRGAVETQAEIVRMIEYGVPGGRRSQAHVWTPVFSFRLPDGTRIEGQGEPSAPHPCCRVGDTVTVRYDPASPGRAKMAGSFDDWFVPAVLGGSGLVFLLVGRMVRRMLQEGAARLAMTGTGRLERIEARLVGRRREATARGPAWVVQARGIDPASRTERLFESAPLPFDPEPQMMRRNTVTVLIDPETPGAGYSMDLSFLRRPSAPAATVGPVRRG